MTQIKEQMQRMSRGTVRAVNGHDNDPWDGISMNEVADATIEYMYVILVNIMTQIKEQYAKSYK